MQSVCSACCVACWLLRAELAQEQSMCLTCNVSGSQEMSSNLEVHTTAPKTKSTDKANLGCNEGIGVSVPTGTCSVTPAVVTPAVASGKASD